MRNSKAYSMKQTNSQPYEDKRIQDHKRIVRDRPKSNSFMIREVPIQRLFNAQHRSNASNDSSDFTKGKNFSEGMNVMDYDMPELVVFIQEDHQQQFAKDICLNRGVLPECKCFFDPDIMNRRRDMSLGIRDAMSINSTGSKCASLYPSLKDAMKMHDFRNFMMKGELEHDSGDRTSVGHNTRKITSETLREAFKKERNFSRSFTNWQKHSSLETSGSRVESPHCKDCPQCLTVTGSGERQVDNPKETSNSTSHAKTSSSVSHQSNDSISSTQSFSFPILPVEWSGSPVRMMEADKSQSRKYQSRKIWFPCC